MRQWECEGHFGKRDREEGEGGGGRGATRVLRPRDAHSSGPQGRSMEQLFHTGWDASPTQQYATGTHLYTLVKRGNV